eukprot:sb/3469670/
MSPAPTSVEQDVLSSADKINLQEVTTVNPTLFPPDCRREFIDNLDSISNSITMLESTISYLGNAVSVLKTDVQTMRDIALRVPPPRASLPPPKRKRQSCLMCSGAAVFKCGGCFKIRYCSANCQATHWPRHSKDCYSRQSDTSNDAQIIEEEIVVSPNEMVVSGGPEESPNEMVVSGPGEPKKQCNEESGAKKQCNEESEAAKKQCSEVSEAAKKVREFFQNKT